MPFFPQASWFVYDIFVRAWETSVFRLSLFLILFRLSFFSFSYLCVTVIDLLLGLLPSSKNSEKASLRRANFTMEWARVVADNFALSFLV